MNFDGKEKKSPVPFEVNLHIVIWLSYFILCIYSCGEKQFERITSKEKLNSQKWGKEMSVIKVLDWDVFGSQLLHCFFPAIYLNEPLKDPHPLSTETIISPVLHWQNINITIKNKSWYEISPISSKKSEFYIFLTNILIHFFCYN